MRLPNPYAARDRMAKRFAEGLVRRDPVALKLCGHLMRKDGSMPPFDRLQEFAAGYIRRAAIDLADAPDPRTQQRTLMPSVGKGYRVIRHRVSKACPP